MTEPRRPDGAIPLDQLEHRRVYNIRSRNLMVGVWNATTQGFVGIRRKFDSLYLFTEYERATSTMTGTAWATSATDVTVPGEIPLTERLRDENGELLTTPDGYSQTNQALFDLLKPLDEAEHQRWRTEWERRQKS